MYRVAGLYSLLAHQKKKGRAKEREKRNFVGTGNRCMEIK